MSSRTPRAGSDTSALPETRVWASGMLAPPAAAGTPGSAQPLASRPGARAATVHAERVGDPRVS